MGLRVREREESAPPVAAASSPAAATNASSAPSAAEPARSAEDAENKPTQDRPDAKRNTLIEEEHKQGASSEEQAPQKTATSPDTTGKGEEKKSKGWCSMI